MRNRVVQILVLSGLVMSCKKNFDSFEEPVATSVATPKSSLFVSSDTAIETGSDASGRAITRMYWLTSESPVKSGSTVTVKMNTTNVAKGTVIPYKITGIDSSNVSSGNLNGNFVIGSNGIDSTTLKLKADSTTKNGNVITTSVKTISLGVTVNSAPLTTAVIAATKFLLDTIPWGDLDLIAPGRGANMFFNTQVVNILSGSSASVNSPDRDVRYSWWQLQKTANAGDYDWSAIDADFTSCISQGQRMSFRVMTLDTDATTWSSTWYDGQKLTYPIFVHNAMQAESLQDWSYGGSWIPNWNSPSYLSAWWTFCKALANHINSSSYNGVAFKNVVYHIDLSGFGNYGEFHSYPFIDSYPSASLKISDASYKSLIDAQTSAFPNFPLIGNIAMFSVNTELDPYIGWYSLTASNAWGKFGFRSDHLGWYSTFMNDVMYNTRTYSGLNFKDEILNRYKIAPVCGEPMNSASLVTNGGSCAFWSLETEVRAYHASQFSNQNGTGVTSSCLEDNYRNASKASGYRLALKGGTVSGSTVTLNWSNSGIAPVYENWDVYLQVRNGSTVVWSGMTGFKPKLFQPGTTSVTTTLGTIPSGSYSVYVIIKDPVGYRQPLPLANKNRQTDGSYKVTDIKI